MGKSAYQDASGKWVYPQVYYLAGQKITKANLIDHVCSHPLVQEAIRTDPGISDLFKIVCQQRCDFDYNRTDVFYGTIKPKLVHMVGFNARHKELRSVKHYDAVYSAIECLLPADEADLYPAGVMPNGMDTPRRQWYAAQRYYEHGA